MWPTPAVDFESYSDPNGNMKDYASFSYWIETCGDDLAPRAPLNGSIDVDVAILGAGYSGLWTAYYLLQR